MIDRDKPGPPAAGANAIDHAPVGHAAGVVSVAPTTENTNPIPRARVVGVPFSVCDYAEALRWLDDAAERSLAEGRARYVCVSNVADAMAARKDTAYAAALEAGDLVAPDGAPVVWALRSSGHAIRRRVYGPTLMRMALEKERLAARRHVLIAGSRESREGVRRRFANVNWVGELDFWFSDLDDAKYQRLADQYEALAPDYAWVSLGDGKQVRFMHRFAPLVSRGVLLGVGAAFDFHAGRTRQAPEWMQENGLEWLFRLSTEPLRLWRRYLIHNPPFLFHWMRESLFGPLAPVTGGGLSVCPAVEGEPLVEARHG